MPRKKSAMKELKKANKRQQRNLAMKKSLKKERKNINALIADNDLKKLTEGISAFVSKVDKSVGKKVIHKKTASRIKSRTLKKLHKLSLEKAAK